MNKKLHDFIEPPDLSFCVKPNRKATLQLLRLHSTELFSNAREVVIEHAGEEYRLRLTRQGKLILTK